MSDKQDDTSGDIDLMLGLVSVSGTAGKVNVKKNRQHLASVSALTAAQH
jgi:hypothetical protein